MFFHLLNEEKYTLLYTVNFTTKFTRNNRKQNMLVKHHVTSKVILDHKVKFKVTKRWKLIVIQKYWTQGKYEQCILYKLKVPDIAKVNIDD